MAKLKIVDRQVRVKVEEEDPLFEEVPQRSKALLPGGVGYSFELNPNNAFITAVALRGKEVELDEGSKKLLKEEFKNATPPLATLSPDRRYINIQIPLVKDYKELVKKLAAWPTGGGYRIPISKFMTLDGINNLLERLPKIKYSEELQDFKQEPIPGFDGVIESLRNVPIGRLNLIAANGQNRNALKKNNKSLEEKFTEHGLASLYDLLFYFPRRYIDKTNPQSIDGLLEGEGATVIGTISKIIEMRNNMGLIFVVSTPTGEEVRATFWRQKWLKQKFKEGDEVILTGKVNFYQGRRQLGGSSIDHADEAAILPIVPIYKQSETKGISTYLVMAALRELLDRLGSVKLPAYFRASHREEFEKILEEMHFPTSIEERDAAMEAYAYYELVYMQLLLEAERRQLNDTRGVSTKASERALLKKTVNSLPYKLTESQKRAVKRITELLKDEKPSTSLLNAEVGSGKTIVAQLACLRAVEGGRQAVLVAPTEILAKQLFDTFQKLLENLKEHSGEEVKASFLGGGLKAAEKRKVLAEVASGEVDILVGTHAVLSSSVKYHDLGLVVIDEQQKFGTEQRKALLSARNDGASPDLLMQTATPIPRSIAQILYGEIEMLLLPERPPGRLPIETEWIQEDPQEIIRELDSPLWRDIVQEAKLGHQSFVITPLVHDSDRVDAASVERSFETLKTHALAGLNVAMVHGKMKKEEQAQVMQAFRDGEYDVLVASTVIEVGVDVPNATRAVILSADRLGASSIWQIRGRVGRSSLQSKCYLVAEPKTEASEVRLSSIVEAENGYEVAKADLGLRGEGTLFGSSQSGKSGMIVASLGDHLDLIQEAREEAAEILSSSYAKRALEEAAEKFALED